MNVQKLAEKIIDELKLFVGGLNFEAGKGLKNALLPLLPQAMQDKITETSESDTFVYNASPEFSLVTEPNKWNDKLVSICLRLSKNDRHWLYPLATIKVKGTPDFNTFASFLQKFDESIQHYEGALEKSIKADDDENLRKEGYRRRLDEECEAKLKDWEPLISKIEEMFDVYNTPAESFNAEAFEERLEALEDKVSEIGEGIKLILSKLAELNA